MSLSDPRDTTKPNPWTLTPSFDERFGNVHIPNSTTSEHEESPIEMFDTFFRNSEQATPRHDETVDVVLPRPSDESWRKEGGVDAMAMPSTERHRSPLGLQVSLEDLTPHQLRREGV
ncbi:hypothetical protein DL93DRAFT_2090761 [Clavulina sp. PMI_390]|nr:hypothetical protein DL93DRAFT_2090761 [Clavulina sp. PMI_390]